MCIIFNSQPARLPTLMWGQSKLPILYMWLHLTYTNVMFKVTALSQLAVVVKLHSYLTLNFLKFNYMQVNLPMGALA